jgi:predicted ATPase
MVSFARELEEKRALLFASIHTYEEIVADFLEDKRVEVTNNGRLQVTKKNRTKDSLEWRNLSSGEKQILILLTQALLWERDPVVYVADEPELSLHVVWQEKLLSSLRDLAGRCQFIIATHSPDIAGGFSDKIINLGKK